MALDPRTTLDPDQTLDGDTTLDDLPGGRGGAGTVQWLDRFRLDRLLGQGGMGQVWEAWDPQLERRVAVKRLLTTSPGAHRRFLREARLQATVAHPGICPIFEVGQTSGEPFLVMPCLDGLPLDQAVDGSPLEYKLELLRQIADAVHAAHQQGLIHRDIKPSNILVETPDDGPPRPVVLDFGIAKPMEGEGLTASGQLVGTPAYMAPEQVEGKRRALDRRTDVYALGATLYRLLAGHPPHRGTGTPLLVSIAQDEPPRLPLGDVPAEVEAIVFKCLEKEKDRRYDSAKALAEDLGRYLAGEPVQARPVTRWIRLSKWMRRHRVAVRVTSAAAVVALTALAWGGWSAWRSEARQAVARQFGAQIEEIEALARYSHLLPLHDVRPDQAELRKRLDAIRPSLEDRDPVVRALASHALGRGHLALDELETAREYLEAAYELAPENGEIAVDLGRVLSELYREQITVVERTRDLGGRASLQEQLSNRLESTLIKPKEQQKQWQLAFGEPARDLLDKQASSDTVDSVELETLRLFHGGDTEAALSHLGKAPSAPMWAYERLRLEGDLRRSWAVELATDSETQEQARKQLEVARATYRRALEVAPSYAAILRDEAQSLALLVGLLLVEPTESETLILEAQDILRRARTVHPQDFQTWLWTMRIGSLKAYLQLDIARDPTEALTEALEAGKQALELEGPASLVWLEIGQIHEMQARWLSLQGRSAAQQFEAAIEAFGQVAPAEQNYSFFVSLGTVQMVLAAQKAEQGLNAAASYEAAISAYRSAAEMHSAPFAALTNLAISLFEATSSDQVAPLDILHQIIEILHRAHSMRPDHMAPFYYLGLSRLQLAQDGNSSGWIVHDDIAQLAESDFHKAIELAPRAFQPWVGLAETLHLRAISTHRRGDDSTALFKQARQAHRRGLELFPDQPIALLNFGWTAYFEGKFAVRDGLDAMPKLTEAKALCQRSLDLEHRSNAVLCLGSVLRMEAEQLINQEAFDIGTLRIVEAEPFFLKILEKDPDHAEAHRSLGRLLTLEAQRRRQIGDNPTSALGRARDFLNRALALEGTRLDFQLADARWHLEKAKWLQANGQSFLVHAKAGRRRLERASQVSRDSSELHRLETEFHALSRPHQSQ